MSTFLILYKDYAQNSIGVISEEMLWQPLQPRRIRKWSFKNV